MNIQLDKAKSESTISRFSISNWIKNSSWRLNFIITTAGLLIIATMFYGFNVGNYTLKKYTPLIDASMEIKLEITTAHLILEEILNGAEDESMSDALKHIDEAQWFAKAMLNGGENFEGRYIALEDPLLRRELNDVSKKIDQFYKITKVRLEALQKEEKSPIKDHQYDAIFKDVLRQADNVEAKLQAEIINKIRTLNIIQTTVILFSIVLLGFIIRVLRCFQNRVSSDMELYNITNEHLQKALEEVKTLQGIIPICGYCKNIRDEQGLWNQLEVYIHSHSDAKFSHGICPDCYEKEIGEFRKKNKKEEEEDS